MVDLRRDLHRGEDVPLLRLTTDDPDPTYLRIAVLNRFNGNEWSSGDREIASRASPPTALIAARVRRCRRADARRTTTRSTATRTSTRPGCRPQFPDHRRSSAAGRLALRRVDDGLHARPTTATTTAGIDLHDDGREASTSPPSTMANSLSAPVGRSSADYLDLPDSLARRRSATWPARSPGERHSRFQQAVAAAGLVPRRPAASPTASSGTPATATATGDLQLPDAAGNGGRTGYCEQFASAMAVMAREPGHPGPGRGRLLEPDQERPARRTSTAPTTCTPGPSCTSRGPAGCASSRRRAPGRVAPMRRGTPPRRSRSLAGSPAVRRRGGPSRPSRPRRPRTRSPRSRERRRVRPVRRSPG